jgi:hypothetical protein
LTQENLTGSEKYWGLFADNVTATRQAGSLAARHPTYPEEFSSWEGFYR